MDMTTERLLHLWGLSQYVKTFKDQEIDYEAVLGLNENDLSKLFGGKLGPKGKFQRHMQELLKNNPKTQEKFENVSSSEIGLETRIEKHYFDGGIKLEEVDIDDSNSLLKEEPGYFHLRLPDQCVHSELEGVTNSQSNAQDIMFNGQPSMLRSLPESPTQDLKMNVKTSHATSSPSDTSSSDSESYIVTSKKWSSKRRLHQRRESCCIPPLKKPVVEGENLVEHYLRQNCIGRAVLRFKGQSVRLDPGTQAKLVHEVIVAEVGPDGQRQISGNRFAELSDFIVALFPKESKSKYYIPRVPANGSTPAVHPKGLLYDKYHNLLKFLRNVGIRNSTRRVSDQTNITEEEFMDDITNPDIANDIEWLESHSLESQCITRMKWLDTVQARMFQLRNCVDPVSKPRIGKACMDSYLKRFGCLSQKWGLNLLLDDFEFLYGGKYTPLINNWPDVGSKLLILAKKREIPIPKNIVPCLQLIPKLFKQPNLIYRSKMIKEVWRPNVLESTHGFFLHVKVLADLDSVVQNLKKKCKNVNKAFLPFPAVVGTTEHEINYSFIVMDDIRYQMESPLAAFDTCFKIYHALHCGYPCQSSYSWLFVQKALYGLKTQWDFTAPSVETFVEAYQEINFI